MRHAAFSSLALAILSFGIFRVMMAYPWQLAVLAATAIGALVYSTQLTWKRMRRLLLPPEATDLTIGGRSREAGSGIIARSWATPGRQLAPGEEDQGEREQQVQPSAQDESRHE